MLTKQKICSYYFKRKIVFRRWITSGHNCSVEEKLEFKRGEDVLEEVESFVIWVI